MFKKSFCLASAEANLRVRQNLSRTAAVGDSRVVGGGNLRLD